MTAVERIIATHQAAGEVFQVDGIGSFVRAEGAGDPVVLMHGLPSSSFLYRKVIPELATRGFRALSFDLPGLGLADRPAGFDYTFTGLGRFAVAAVRALGLDRFHLVVHDAGGPVGFELAAAIPERVRSLTLLNTIVDMETNPFPMEVYARFATGDRWPALPPTRLFREVMYRIGIRNRAAVPAVEVDVYRALVLRSDNGRAYLLPSPRSPADPPTITAGVQFTGAITLNNGMRIPLGPQGSIRSTEGVPEALEEAQYAPEFDPDRIEFTRPPLLVGADVPSVPPPDNCAGYLGAATSTSKIGLIRLPHVAEWFDTSNLTPSTPFEQNQTSYISFTLYGSGPHRYERGSPVTGSLGNEELKVDASGGTTVVVWPPGLSLREQEQVFAYANSNGWAILRGGEVGEVTTANVFLRLKGASPSYQGGYTPTPERQGMPCYFNDNPDAKRWHEVTGDKYVASARSIGAGAPQGVNCTVDELLDGSCLAELKAYIAETGGSYFAVAGASSFPSSGTGGITAEPATRGWMVTGLVVLAVLLGGSGVVARRRRR